jgi:NADH-quinone oxidoreductase subunit C
VDRVENLEVVYMFGHAGEPCRVKLWLMAAKGDPVPSLANLIPAADWHEREAFDMLGQVFSGHPDPRRILLPEDADFHPLLRDFKAVPGPAEA